MTSNVQHWPFSRRLGTRREGKQEKSTNRENVAGREATPQHDYQISSHVLRDPDTFTELALRHTRSGSGWASAQEVAHPAVTLARGVWWEALRYTKWCKDIWEGE